MAVAVVREISVYNILNVTSHYFMLKYINDRLKTLQARRWAINILLLVSATGIDQDRRKLLALKEKIITPSIAYTEEYTTAQ